MAKKKIEVVKKKVNILVKKKAATPPRRTFLEKSFTKKNVSDIRKSSFTTKRSPEMEILEKYNINADEVEVEVKIVKSRGRSLRYEINIPGIAVATSALLDEIRHELVTEVAVSSAEILDPNIVAKLKKKFKEKAESILRNKLPNIDEETKKFLVGILLQEMVGLGKIEYLLNDLALEEIVINSTIEPVRVYHKRYGWLETNITIKTEDQIQNYANIIARRVGRQITTLNPLLDAHLVTGDRANAVLYPVSTKGNTITIRKFARDPWTVTDFIKNSTVTSEIMALIWMAMEYEMSILVSGGTASGKTSLLNVMMPFIPPNHRLISIEQTRELQIPKFLYWCPLITRLPNPEGKGGVDMLDLLVNSLRMRPDRIILGEIRRKEEAQVLFEAMHTGHSVYSTVHADSLTETISRLVNPPISVPENMLEAVNLAVVMFRDRRRGIRRIYQLGEFLSSEETGEVKIKTNLLYRWNPVDDKIVKHMESLRLFDDLSRNTALSIDEINEEIAMKKKILDWLVKNNIRYVEDVGKIMNEYYVNKDYVLDVVNKKLDPKKLLGI